MPRAQAQWGLSTGELIHGLGFLPAWWPQNNGTSYMAGQVPKDEHSNNQDESALASVAQSQKSHSVTSPFPWSKQPLTTQTQRGAQAHLLMWECQRVCSHILKQKLHSLHWYQLLDGATQLPDRKVCSGPTLCFGTLFCLPYAGNILLRDNHRTSDSEPRLVKFF